MDNVFLIMGIVCVVAAILGGGLHAFGIQMPLLQSLPRQALLAIVGAGFIFFGVGGFGVGGAGAGSGGPYDDGSTASSGMPPSDPDSSANSGATDASNSGAATPPEEPAAPGKVVMTALEEQINRPGRDFDGFGKSADNAEICAELCRADSDCDAMTYVVSLKRCWLKEGVPEPESHPDMISSVKVRPPNMEDMK